MRATDEVAQREVKAVTEFERSHPGLHDRPWDALANGQHAGVASLDEELAQGLSLHMQKSVR